MIVGTRRLRITAVKKADEASYDMDFRWRNVPTAAGAPDPALEEGWLILEIAVAVLAFAVAAMQLWIWFALSAKRFHDRDRKGWWLLISLIPPIGILWVFVVLGFFKGTEGDNRFGPDPLAAEGSD